MPLFSEWGLANQLGTIEYIDDRFFRAKTNPRHRHVMALWPVCAAHVSSDGNYLPIALSKGASQVRPLQ